MFGKLVLIYGFQFRSAFQPRCRNSFSNFIDTYESIDKPNPNPKHEMLRH